jgi:hypothetical protein
MTTKYETPRAFVQGVMWAAQKSRSNMYESGTEDLGKMLFPKLWSTDWDNVLLVAERMLAEGREPTGQDAVNLSYLVHRDEHLLHLLDCGPVLQGFEPFPEPHECMVRWATVGLP